MRGFRRSLGTHLLGRQVVDWQQDVVNKQRLESRDLNYRVAKDTPDRSVVIASKKRRNSC